MAGEGTVLEREKKGRLQDRGQYWGDGEGRNITGGLVLRRGKRKEDRRREGKNISGGGILQERKGVLKKGKSTKIRERKGSL